MVYNELAFYPSRSNVCTHRKVTLQVLAPDLEEVVHIISDSTVRRERSVRVEHRDNFDEIGILSNNEWAIGGCRPERNVDAQKFLGISAAVREAGYRCLVWLTVSFARLDMIKQVAC